MASNNMNWPELAATSHYQTAVAVGEAIKQGDLPEASTGIQELIDTLSRADKRALRSHLIRLMAHIITWKTQPERRSRSWRSTLRNARREIAGLQEDTPSLTREVVKDIWQACFESAKEEAEGEMNRETTIGKLSWSEVFEKDYDLPSAQS